MPIYEIGSSSDIIDDGTVTFNPISNSDYDVSNISLGALSPSSHTVTYASYSIPTVTIGTNSSSSRPSGESWHSNDEYWDALYTNTYYDKTVYFT